MGRTWGRKVLVVGVALTAITAAHGEFLSAAKTPPLPEGAVKQLWNPVPDEATALAPVAFSPDGKLLALATGPTVVLWDAATGKEIHTLKGHSAAVAGIAFRPDGKAIATASLDSTVRLWDTAAGTETRKIEGHKEAVFAVAFSPDGKLLASGGQDKIVRLWQVADGSEVRQMPGHQHFVHALAFTPDGKTLASGGKDRVIRLWDPATAKETQQLKGHQNRVNVLVFGTDGKTLASASQDSTIRLWDIAAGKEVRRLAGWTGEVRSLVLAADGRTFASVSRDYTVRIWETLTGDERRVFRNDGGDFVGLALSQDGKVLASSRPGSAILWDVTGMAHDGQMEKVEGSQQNLDKFWGDLARDAGRAHDSVWRLAAVPEQSVPFLAEHLQAQQNFDNPQRVAQLIADLGNDRFVVRNRAADELEALAGIVRPALEKELNNRPTLDVRRRIEQLLERANSVAVPPVYLRAVRGVETLERIGTPEARRALETLAKAPEGSRLAVEAEASLRRMKDR